MLRLTRQADYGILLLAEMASSAPGAIVAASELAATTGLPMPMVSKTLKVLAREGLLVSVRGPRGGYRLSRRAEDISVADVVSALEGPIAMTSCSETSGGDCGIEAKCRVHGNWLKLNRVVIGALAGLSLAEMAEPSPPRLVRLDELARSASAGGI